MTRAQGLNIWFVELGEPLPFQQGQRLLRYGELTRALARRGHRVTWWACDFSHMTRSFIGPPNGRVDCDGVEIVLVHGSGYRRNIGLGRLRHVAAHARQLARLIEHQPPPDIIVSAMPTIDACAEVARFAARHGVPLIVDIRDEWPEDFVRLLPAALRPLARLAVQPMLARLRRVCRAATSLTAVTEWQLNYGLGHADRARGPRDAVFHTGARGKRPEPEAVSARIQAWRERGLQASDFIGVFVGTMSKTRPLDATIAAARRLEQRIPMKLVLVGGGDLEAHYRTLAGECPAITFAGWGDMIEVAALTEMADVLLAPYSRDYGFSMPTKIFDYMAAARPMLTSCPGETEALIRDEGIGLPVQADDAGSIEQALLTLHGDPALRRRMGQRARALFEEKYALESIVERYADHIETIAARRAAP